MKIKHPISIFVAIFTLSAFSAYADTNDSDSIKALSAWTNQSGSTLYIDSVGSNGKLTGTYINRAEGYRCKDTPYPVTGWIYGTAITFTTKWKNPVESCDSITAWTGFYHDGEIKTLWQLVINGSRSTSQIIKGEDTFKRSTSAKSKSLVEDK